MPGTVGEIAGLGCHQPQTNAGQAGNIADTGLLALRLIKEETVMKTFGMIGAACLAVVLATATPALARGGHFRGGGFHGGGAHFAGGGIRGGFRGGHGGFGPAIAAGVVAGAVIGGAGYYGGYGPGYYDDSYAYDAPTAYDNGAYGGYDNGYATRNGFVCQPGTVFRGEDGRRHLCQ
jgi:hypothetical protein